MIRDIRNAIQPVDDKCNMYKDDINKILGSFMNKDAYAGNEEGVIFMSSSKPVRSKRYKYIVHTDDREIFINKKGTEACGIARLNLYNKPYFIEEDGSICFIKEEEYINYDWEVM